MDREEGGGPSALAALALLGGIGWAAPEARAETVVIRDDGGGNITAYRARREELARVDQVRIEGKCLSACTIFTTLPNACVHPAAQIGFHGVDRKTGIAAIDRRKDYRMGEFYRGEVQRLYMAEWRHLQGIWQYKMMNGRQLKLLDPRIRICGDKG